MKHELPAGLTADDYEISATIRDLRKLDPVIERAASLDGTRPASLLDIGCGIGGLTTYVADRLGIEERLGIDRDADRLAKASERGIRTMQLDLNHDRIPLDDASVGMAVSFGVFEHVVWYDNCLREVARVLEDGRPFVISMPNLGSFVNRFALLGQITDEFSDETLALRPTGDLAFAPAGAPRLRRQELPLDRNVLRFR